MILTVEILLEVKKARIEHAEGYHLRIGDDINLRTECNLLRKEIEVLENVLKNRKLLS